jgi:hypothetical protein
MDGSKLVLLLDALDLGDETGSEAQLILKEGALHNCVDTWPRNGTIFCKPMIKRILILAFATSLLALAGCKTISSQGVEAFCAGVTAAKTQSGEAFRTVNELMAEDQLNDAAKATNLTEQLFTKILNPEDVGVWDKALANLESYARHLQALSSPEVSKSFEQEAENLGGELQTFGQNLQQTGLIGSPPQISAGVATAFAELGSLIIRLKAQHDAMRIASAANTNINTMLRLMSASLGETSSTGLRGTVRAHWLDRLGTLKEQFKKQADESAKRQLAGQFVDTMGRRDALDAVLVSLRRSLLSLADLHQSIAKGDRATAIWLAGTIADEIKATRDIYSQFQNKLKRE